MSDGSRSGVNWMRQNDKPVAVANERAINVLATPGRSSSSTWPSASRPMSTSSSTSPLADDRALDLVEDRVRGLDGRREIGHDASTRSRRLDHPDDGRGQLVARRRTRRPIAARSRSSISALRRTRSVRRRRERQREGERLDLGRIGRLGLGLAPAREGIRARAARATHEVEQRQPDEHGEHPDLEARGRGALARRRDDERARDDQAQERALEQSLHQALDLRERRHRGADQRGRQPARRSRAADASALIG